ncbi:MAG TPA: SpaH/EbpB family LPXTG-anchored major pilin [Lachnospiraceae bacterium]|nr:SpaH/EbpB family LPXTG-anchored major pilin [Lachnospiraceae bacterium]
MKKRIRKFLAMALSVVMMMTMAVPVMAEEIDLNVNNNSADSIYAALQLAKAGSATAITAGGTTAKANITVNNVNANATLKAYRLIDITLNENGTVASVALNSNFSAVWTTLGINSIDDLSNAYKASTTYLSTLMNALASADLSGITPVTTPAATAGSVTFSNMDMGTYYIVQGTSGDANGQYTAIVPMLVTVPFNDNGWYADVTANAKNKTVDIVKTVKAAEDTNYGKTADQFINQTLNYKVAIGAPQWNVAAGQTLDTTKIKLQISDTLTNQTYVDDSMTVYAIPNTYTGTLTGNETATELALINGAVNATSWFTTTPGAGNTSFTTALNSANFSDVVTGTYDTNTKKATTALSAKYKQFIFLYNAKLTADAVIGGTAGNPNSVTYQYSRNPANTDDIGTLTDNTKTFTYEVNLDKYYTDKIGNENVAKELAGAKFQLKNSAGSVLWFIPGTDGHYTYFSATPASGITYYTDAACTTAAEAGTTTVYAKIGTQIVTSALITGGNSSNVKATNLWMTGLDEGTYTLSETEAPQGYSKVSDISITLTAVVDATTGQKTGALADTTISSQSVVGSTGKLNFGIEDKSGITLPSTGSVGTIIFTVIGLIVILGCVAIFVIKKSKEKYSQE